MNQTAFIGLWKKEWVLMRGYYFGLAAFNALWLVLAPVIIQTEQYLMTASILLILHMFYLSGLFMHSFNREAEQLELTLHSPQSGYMIVGVKMLQSFVVFLTSLVVVSGVGILAASYELMLSMQEIFSVFTRMGILLIGFSLALALLLFFLWSLHQVMKRYIGGLSVFICIAIFFGISAFLTWIQETYVYQSLTSFAPFLFEYEVDSLGGMLYVNFGVDALSVGDLLFYFAFNSLFLLFGMWILDRKVEV
ncbi:hypothetical protein H0266_13335 [Halobacillus locisalis]|uniref:ABC-2 type transport system permease protein n=1 Tax=Halobacillus locisalis TaxID=220753 RepID=A0A838CVA7_9BACI|nr:hypothetical protein [Halobacillus locisalis]MBA2175874.1 hypothetical protein [Halobacillus locisalis]